MTVTTDGRIVATAGTGPEGGRLRLRPRRQAARRSSRPPKPPTNVEFGGPDRKTLYITAGKSLYRIATTMTGFHLWAGGK